MDFMLRDKVVLMTGGAEGIDAATEGQTGRLFERNLLHCYNMAHYALPYLKQARGAIVSIAIPIRFLYLKPLPVIAIVLCSPCNARGGEAGVSEFLGTPYCLGGTGNIASFHAHWVLARHR